MDDEELHGRKLLLQEAQAFLIAGFEEVRDKGRNAA
jgi:hypothetical protein